MELVKVNRSTEWGEGGPSSRDPQEQQVAAPEHWARSPEASCVAAESWTGHLSSPGLRVWGICDTSLQGNSADGTLVGPS